MITLYLLLLLAVPSGGTIAVLGSLGRPALLWGIVMLVWWIVAKLQARPVDLQPARQPVRIAYLAFLVIALVGFAAALLRGQPEDQVSPAFTAIIRILSWAGVLLITVDGIRTMNDLLRVVRRVGIAAGALAALGLAQGVTKTPLIDFFGSIPGFTMSAVDVAVRGGLSRVAGTAIHPLEFATVLNSALPLLIAAAVSHGFRWQAPTSKNGWWLPVCLVALSGIVGVSRLSIIGFAVAVLTMIPVLPRRYRGVIIVGGVAMVAVVVAVVPGLLSTTVSLFTGAASDPSTQSRVGGLDRAPEFIAASPIVGVGFGLFLPRYYIFDNEWVLITVELGVLGVLAFAGVFGSAIWSAARARKRSADAGVRLLGYALAASVVNIAVLFAFFDGLSFPQSGGMLFLMVGLCGAIRTIGETERTLDPDIRQPPRASRLAKTSQTYEIAKGGPAGAFAQQRPTSLPNHGGAPKREGRQSAVGRPEQLDPVGDQE